MSKRAERLDRLHSALQSGGYIRLKDAARLLDVSEMTVRRDIAAATGRFSYLGGYIAGAPDDPGGLGYMLDRERDAHVDLKRAACAAAATLVAPRETIFLDCGTTIPHLAGAIPANSGITVVCYAMNVAEIVCKKPGVRVLLLGGLYHPSSASFFSQEALETLRGIGINKAFVSAGGVHPTFGVSCSNFHEVEVKLAAMANAVNKILVLDSTKFPVVKPAVFARLDAFDTVCCDGAIPDQARVTAERAGARVLTA